MLKIYKAPLWQIIFFPSLVFCGGLVILFLSKDFIYQIAGILSIPAGIYAFWVLKNTKVLTDDEHLISENYLSSFKKQRIEMRWTAIAKIFSSSFFTYIVLGIKEGEDIVPITDPKKVIRISSSISNYPELIKEVLTKAWNASIDEKTKRIVEKGCKK